MGNRKGSILVLSLFLCAVLFLSAAAIAVWSISGIRNAVFMKDYQAALYLAEAGVNQKLYELNLEPSETNDIPYTEPFGSGFGSYEVVYAPGPPAAVSSTGRVNNRERTVSIEVRDIAQAFNKHAVYGRNLDITAQVVGSIYYDSSGIDMISVSGNNYTLTPVDQVDTTVSLPLTDMNSYESDAHHIYADGDCTVHPGVHPPAGYDADDDAYQFTFLPDGIVYIREGSAGGSPSVTLINVNLAGSIVVEGDISLSGNCAVTPAASDWPAIIADNISINPGNHAITGLVFGKDTVRMEGGTVNGIIAGETITITSGTVTYNWDSYRQNNSPVYRHFSGGQRAFIPAAGSWKEE